MRLSLLSLVALVLATAPHAQVRQGLSELGGTASVFSYEAGADRITVLSLEPSFGYFLTDRLEVGLALSYLKVENVDGDGAITAFGEYHFGPFGATSVPFLGARLGTSVTDDTDLVLGGSGGVKVFFLPGGALTGEVLLLTDGDDLDIGAQGGVSIFF